MFLSDFFIVFTKLLKFVLIFNKYSLQAWWQEHEWYTSSKCFNGQTTCNNRHVNSWLHVIPVTTWVSSSHHKLIVALAIWFQNIEWSSFYSTTKTGKINWVTTSVTILLPKNCEIFLKLAYALARIKFSWLAFWHQLFRQARYSVNFGFQCQLVGF